MYIYLFLNDDISFLIISNYVFFYFILKSEEDEIIEACLEECIHGVIWEHIAERGKDMTREMFCALVR